MTQLEVIKYFFKTFYPQLDINVSIDWKDHFSMSRETNWLFNVEILNIGTVIYNPENFTPVHTLKNCPGTVDLTTVFDNMSNFIPHLISRIKVFYIDYSGSKVCLDIYYNQEPHRSF